MENGSTLVRARNISTCTAEFCGKIGSRITLKSAIGLSACPNQPLLMRARSCAAAQLSENIAGLVQKASSKTQFCGRVQKLLPKVSFTVVLSAPEKRSAASIATSTSRSNYENRAASSTNANAFPASGCRSDKNQADRKRRFGPEILSNPLRCRSGSCRTDPG